MSSSFGTTEVTTSSAPAWQRLLTCSARHAGTSSIALLSTSTSRFLRSSDPSTARVPCELCQVKHNHSLSNAPARLRQHGDLVWRDCPSMALLMALLWRTLVILAAER